MAFDAEERAALLAVRGVGPTVIDRLEQLGIDSMAVLAQGDTNDILGRTAAMLRSPCWKNSLQARAAIDGAIKGAIDVARARTRRCG